MERTRDKVGESGWNGSDPHIAKGQSQGWVERPETKVSNSLIQQMFIDFIDMPGPGASQDPAKMWNDDFSFTRVLLLGSDPSI